MLTAPGQLARRRAGFFGGAAFFGSAGFFEDAVFGFAAAGALARKTSFISGSAPGAFSNPQPPRSQTRTLPPFLSRRSRYGLPHFGQASGIGRAESVKSQAG
jgi:hypothetical protein